MPHPVFISYARDASRAHARAIHAALGGTAEDICFLDEQDIGIGDPVSERLIEALFDARVVVILAEPLYFTRRYCLQEFHLASGPFSRVAERPGATAAEKTAALRGIVVAVPEHGVDPMLDRFPPTLAGRNWPRADDTDTIAAFVRAELATTPPTLRERYTALGADEEAKARFLAKSALPTPLRIGSIPMAPTLGIPVSIGDAFVGRADDMWRIHDVLTNRRGDLRTAAGITGSIEAGGGFGKTRIAVEYLYRFGTRSFQGGLFWIDAEQDPEDRLYEILVALNPSADLIEVVRNRPGGVAAAVARAIRSLPQDRPPPLFIVDNVPEPAPRKSPKSLETWCPVPGEASVLATSRTHLALGSGRIEAVRITGLDVEAAIDLIVAGVSGLDRDEWGEIAEWVGYLPLALELLNRALRAGALSPAVVLKASREASGTTQPLEEARKALRRVVPDGAVRGVSQAFAMSYKRLTVEEQLAARLLAWMAPAPIPLLVLDEFPANTFSPATRAALLSRSFMSEVAEGEGAFLGTMHRVLADFLLTTSPSLTSEAESVVSALTGSLRRGRGAGDAGAPIYRICFPVIATALGRFNFKGASREWVRFVCAFGNDSATEMNANGGMPHRAETLFMQTLRIASTNLGEDDQDTLRIMSRLSRTRGELGDLAGARETMERLLTTMERKLGPEHPDTLRLVSDLGKTMSERDELKSAAKMFQRVFEARTRLLGPQDNDTLLAMRNLATALYDLGQHRRAQGLLTSALEGMHQNVGLDHPGTLSTMLNLALVLSDAGDWKGARELEEQVLLSTRKMYGRHHWATTQAAWNLLQTLVQLGAREDAEELVANDLEWLAAADDTTLSASQIEIRNELQRWNTVAWPLRS